MLLSQHLLHPLLAHNIWDLEDLKVVRWVLEVLASLRILSNLFGWTRVACKDRSAEKHGFG